MKKSLFFVAAAALVLAGCNNDVTLDENTALVGSNTQKEISFSPLSQSPKRVISNDKHGFIDGTTFETTWDMTVAAVDITNNREFFPATEFHYNYANGATGGGHTYWGGVPARYWPLSPVQVNFLAIAHANDNNTTGVNWTNTKADNKVVVEMSDNYAYNTAQRDFLYAIGNGQVTQEGNALSFPKKVDMQFKHTQSYLVFNVKAADAASTAIHITDLKLKGIYTGGIATIARVNPATYADQDVNLSWASRTYPGASNIFRSITENQNTIDYQLTTTLKEKGHLMIVPNVTNNVAGHNDEVTLQIAYTLDSKPYTYDYKITADEFEAGKKYIYNITFKLHEIFVDPEVLDWDTDINDNDIADDDVNIVIPSVEYNASGANVSIGATKGTYTFTISNIPAKGAEEYSIEEEGSTGDTDFITTVTKVDDSELAAGNVGSMTVTVETTEAANNTYRAIVLKLGTARKMKITLTKKTSI